MRSRGLLLTVVLAALAAYAPSPAHSQWIEDGVPLVVGPGTQNGPVMVANGGGVLVAWNDNRTAMGHIYAQSLNSAGVAQWPANGVLISDAAYPQGSVQVVGDGQGGFFAAYRESRGGPGIYLVVQHVNSAGARLWGNGIALTGTADLELDLISDNLIDPMEGPGLIVAWQDTRNGSGNPDIYLQAVTAAGVVRFVAGGIPVTTIPGSQSNVRMVTDGIRNFGGRYGAIVAWSDNRTGDQDIYAQRIDHSGVARWTAGGAPVCTVPGMQWSLQMTAGAGQGVAIIYWQDGRVDAPGMYIQKFGSTTGTPTSHWGTNGLQVTGSNSDPTPGLINADRAGGAVIAWAGPFPSTTDVRAQRFNGDGSPRWAPGGTFVGDTLGYQDRPIVLLGSTANPGGAIVAWRDAPTLFPTQARAQAFDSTGTALWPASGVPFCSPPTGFPLVIQGVTDGAGGGIFVWSDNRNGNIDLYANRVTASGGVVGVEERLPRRLALGAAMPNPTRAGSSWSLALPRPARVTTQVVGVDGRIVRVLERDRDLPAGRHTIAWDGVDSRGRRAPAGVYFVRAMAGGEVSTGRLLVLR